MFGKMNTRRMLALPLLALALTSALAPKDAAALEIEPYANCDDTDYTLNLEFLKDHDGTGFRNKDDDSSLYIKIAGFSGSPARLYVDGAYDDKGTNWTDCTQGIYRSHHYGEWKMYNLVRESGRNHARLTAWRESGPGKVWGQWSPDCCSEWKYTVLPG